VTKRQVVAPLLPLRSRTPYLSPLNPKQQGGGGGLPNPFDMGKLMESVKKAQQMVQVETARVQKELDELSVGGAGR
jgi:hypothetical protein